MPYRKKCERKGTVPPKRRKPKARSSWCCLLRMALSVNAAFAHALTACSDRRGQQRSSTVLCGISANLLHVFEPAAALKGRGKKFKKMEGTYILFCCTLFHHHTSCTFRKHINQHKKGGRDFVLYPHVVTRRTEST